MDLGKDQPHTKLPQTPDLHQEKTPVPEVIGTWSLRNREQLRKRKAEAQEKQTSQWLLGEQKKRKWQRTGKGNQRGRKREQNAEPKVEPLTQRAKEMMEKALTATEKETEPPGSVTEAFPLVASSQKVVPLEHSPEIHQDSVIHQEDSSEYQEMVAQNHSSETCQHVTEPEDLSPKICLETAVPQDHSSKVCQAVAQPEVLSPQTCQDIAVVQDDPPKMSQDMAEPEVPSSKIRQEVAVPKVLPSTTSEDIADLEGYSPDVTQHYPKPDVIKHYPLDTYQKPAGPSELISEPDQVIAKTEGSFPKTQEIVVSKNLSTKTYQETIEPECFSHETYTEVTVPKVSSPKTTQETPGPEDYSPETYKETPEPEDLSTKTYENSHVSKEWLPEPNQEAGGPQVQASEAHQEDSKDVLRFPQELKEKAKAEPEIPATPHVPQEIHPENDVYSYVLF